MNAKNSEWIKYPSKRFPGKYFYFNVYNGETVWSLNEVDVPLQKKILREDNIHKVTEPESPPADNDGQNISPMFGQATFPKYLTNMPNILWTPIPISPQVFVANQRNPQTFFPGHNQIQQTVPSTDHAAKTLAHVPGKVTIRRMSDQNTQTFGSEIETFVQSSGIPLSQRFSNYEKRNADFVFPKTSPNKTNMEIQKRRTLKPLLKEPVLKRIKNSEHCLQNKTESHSNWFTFPNSTFNWCKEKSPTVEKSTESSLNKTENLESTLDKSDLRFMLIAKRRKSIESVFNEDDRQTTIVKSQKEIPKKRVTFDLGDVSDISNSEASKGPVENMEASENMTISKLKGLAKSTMGRSRWYIVVDTNILLDNFEFINKFILSDESCHLLIPLSVKSEIEAISVASSGFIERTMAARKLIRLVINRARHIEVEANQMNTEESVTEGIINCCLQTMEHKYHVVLVTNNSNLYIKAKSIDIICFKLDEINSGSKEPITFDLKKVDVKENLFLQKPCDKLFLGIDNSAFNHYNAWNRKSGHVEVKNANTSPINFDVIEVGNAVEKHANSDTTGTTAEISRNIQNLNIIDLQSRKTVNNDNVDNIREFEVKKTIFNDKYSQGVEKLTDNQITFKPIKNDENYDNAFSKVQNVNYNKEKHNRNVNTYEVKIDSNFKYFSKENSEITKTNTIIDASKSKQEITENTNRHDEKETFKADTVRNIDPIDEKLRKFQVYDEFIEKKLLGRMNEWICIYTQIMEDVLSEVLQRTSNKINNLSSPWTLREAVECMRPIYAEDSNIINIIERLSYLIYSYSFKNGILNPNIKANEFMKIFGCGVLLVDALKDILPHAPELKEAESSLSKLLDNIKDPAEPESPKAITAPVVYTSDIEIDTETRHNFIKKRSDVLVYLKKHFPDWRSYDPAHGMNEPQKKEDPKIFRTIGKNLSLLKLDGNKFVSLNKNDRIKDSTKKHDNNEANKALDKAEIDKNDCAHKTCTVEENKDHESKNRNKVIFTENKNYDPTIKKTPSAKKVVLKRNFGKNTDTAEVNIDNSAVKRNLFTAKEFDESKNNISDVKSNIDSNSLLAVKEIDKYANNSKKILINDIKIIRKINNNKIDDIYPDHGNTFDQISDGPKVIRNVQLIAAFEDKLTSKSNSNEDKENLTHDTYNCDNPLLNNLAQNNFKNSDFGFDKDLFTEKSGYIDFSNDSVHNNEMTLDGNPKDDSTNDSGFENESTQAYSLVKMFFAELSGTYKLIYTFIDTSINEFRDETMQEERKKVLQDKANETHLHILEIIGKLKSIIDRETNESVTLKTMLVKAGVQISEDKRIARYRQVVAKCLEQALMLEKALRIMLLVTLNDFDNNSVISETVSTNMRYLNIFE